MRKVIDKIEIVINSHVTESTDFLDPYERLLAKSILNRFMDINYIEAGGFLLLKENHVVFPHYFDTSIVPVFVIFKNKWPFRRSDP